MAIGRDQDVRRQFRTLCDAGAIGGLTDGQLLERFAGGGGEAAEAAFGLLVERHGPMVLRVCRAVLADPHAAEDAFQAAFLVLVKRSRSLWVRDSLGPWLHQVALRTASCARSRATVRRKHERRAAEIARGERGGERMDGDLEGALHQEIGRLPERYRAPVVLCDLEGRTHEQAARHLGCPVGTVKSRLTRARQKLRRRLTRLGLAPAAGLGVSVAAESAGAGAAAAVPAELARATILNMTRFAAGRASAGLVPAAVAALAGEALRTMMRTKIQILTATLVAAAVAAGAAIGASGAGGNGPLHAAGPAAPQDDPSPPVADRDEAARDDAKVFPVRRGKLSLETSGRGTLEATRAANVISEIEGQTTILSLLPEGTRVRKGDVVAELDSNPLKDKLVNQEIATKKAEADHENAIKAREEAEIDLNGYERGIFPQEQDALRYEVAAAEEAIQRASSRADRTREAARRLAEMLAASDGAKSPSDILAELEVADRQDEAEAALGSGKRALVLAKHKLEAFVNYTYPKTMGQLKAAVKKSKSDELAKMQALELEKSKLEKLERQIAKITLHAPSDGTIVYANPPRPSVIGTLAIEEGASVRERQIILSVVDLGGPMRVNARIPEAFVDRVRKDMRARIRVDAFPGRVLSGVVESVAPLPNPINNSRDTTKYYTTLVRIEDGLPGSRPGLTADVEIFTHELDDTIGIPVQAVVLRGGKPRVAVKKADGGFEWRDVTLGVGDDRLIEVKEGLQEGEAVALVPLSLLSPEERRERSTDAPSGGARPRQAPADRPRR